MRRSEFLSACAAFSVSTAGAPALAANAAAFDPMPGTWRTFRIVTEVRLASGKGRMAWIPVPSFTEGDWMRPGPTTWQGNASEAEIVRDPRWNTAILYARWNDSVAEPRIVATSTVSARDRAVDFARPAKSAALSPQEFALYTAPTKFIPTDGIVKEFADRITAGAPDDLEKVRRIYGWIVDNTYRKPQRRGCGLGDVSFLLQTGDLGGKCADLNGLAVGLARASGLPARDIYGVRVAPSRFGYKSLGANRSSVTKAQHCRAEVHLGQYGWIPIDPADVRKVILEEPPGNLPANDPKVVAARRALFGAWEGNYAAYNDAHDVALPGSNGPTVPFLMYPQAEIGGERLDSLDAAHFQYAITARED